MTQPIGILDSGVGGLTVLKEAERQLPNESFIYIGDNGRCPYGTRSTDEIKQFTGELAHFLVDKDAKMIVVACNTATAIALPILEAELPVPVIGVIDAGVAEALRVTNGRIVVTATQATVQSHSYLQKLENAADDLTVIEQSCSPLVPLIEDVETTDSEIEQTIRTLFTPIRDFNPDTVILGCTHFPILASQIQAFLGDSIQLVDAGKASVSELSHQLEKRQMMANTDNKQDTQFYTTGEAQSVAMIGARWLGRTIDVQTVTPDRLRRS